MGSALSALSCAGWCCCAGVQSAFGDASAMVGHMLIYLLCAIFSMVMALVIDSGYTSLPFVGDLCTSSCANNGTIFRVSFVLFVYYTLHALFLCFPGSNCCHTTMLFLKFCGVCGGILASFWIENDFFSTYGEVARVGSFPYLIFQCMVFINCAYDINECVVKRARRVDDEGNPQQGCLWVLLIGTVLVVAGIYAALGESIHLFGGTGCDRNNFFIATSIICFTLCAAGAMLVPKGSAFAATILGAYATFLLYCGLFADPDYSCNSQRSADSAVYVWSGIILSALSLSYGAYSLSKVEFYKESAYQNNDMEEPLITGDGQQEKEDLAEERRDEEEERKEVQGEDEEDELTHQRQQAMKFHIVMMFASLYFAMLFSGWGKLEDKAGGAFQHSDTTVWINILTQWCTFFFYAWTLVAMYRYPERFEWMDE